MTVTTAQTCLLYTSIALGESLTVGQYQVTIGEEIPQGHKFALKPIAKGEEVIKYGFRIGFAKEDIAAGGWVHAVSYTHLDVYKRQVSFTMPSLYTTSRPSNSPSL